MIKNKHCSLGKTIDRYIDRLMYDYTIKYEKVWWCDVLFFKDDIDFFISKEIYQDNFTSSQKKTAWSYIARPDLYAETPWVSVDSL